jgi:hypothetical protein
VEVGDRLASAGRDFLGGVDLQRRVEAVVALHLLEAGALAEGQGSGAAAAGPRRTTTERGLHLAGQVGVHQVGDVEQLAGGLVVLGDDQRAAVGVLGDVLNHHPLRGGGDADLPRLQDDRALGSSPLTLLSESGV